MLFHAINFMHRVWVGFVVSLGNTTLGFILHVFFIPVFASALVVAVVFFREGKAALMTHLTKTFTLAAAMGVGAEIVVLFYQIASVGFADHSDLALENRTLLTENSALNEKNSRLVEPGQSQAKISQLQRQIEVDKKNLSPTIKAFIVSRENRTGTAQMEYILTSGSVRPLVNLNLKCDIPISEVVIRTLAPSSAPAPTYEKLAADEYRLSMQGREWSPSSPMWAAVFFIPPVNAMPQCSFTEN